MLCGGKLPESTRDKLQDLLGVWIPLSWGSFWTGEWFHLMFGIPPGNNLRSRLPGMLVRNVCALRWGMLRSAGDNPTSLRLIAG